MCQRYIPDFREPNINDVDIAQINPSTERLSKVNILRSEIWKRLEKVYETNEWDDIKDNFKKAKMDTREFVYKLKKKMEDKLNLDK